MKKARNSQACILDGRIFEIAKRDISVGNNLAAGDGVGVGFMWRKECDIMAETSIVDDHKLRAGRAPFILIETICALGMAMELNFDAAFAAGRSHCDAVIIAARYCPVAVDLLVFGFFGLPNFPNK